MIQVHIINLFDRNDRLQNTLQELKSSYIEEKQIHVVEAIDTRGASAADISVRFPEIKEEALAAIKNNYREEHYQLTSGAIGCFFSHRKAWQNIADTANDNEIHVILEDDIRFVNHFKAKNILTDSTFLKEKLRLCDIYLLGHVGLRADHPLLALHRSHEYPEDIVVDWFIGLQAYCIQRKTAVCLLQYLQVPVKQLDWQLSDLIPQGKITVRAATTRLCKCLDQDSDIQTAQPCYKQW